MKLLKNISVLFFGLIFFLSSTGIIIFQSHCICTGDQYVSFYVQPETCEQNFHTHHIHDFTGNEISSSLECCHECTAHANDCGCDAPEVKYIKLINQITNDEVKYVKVQSDDILAVEFNNEISSDFLSEKRSEESLYTGPPPHVKTSLEFLINICQLKIAHTA